MILTDSHLHILSSQDIESLQFLYPPCTSHSGKALQSSFCASFDSLEPPDFAPYRFCAGSNPRNPDFSAVKNLERLLEQKKVDAIGECGFDFSPNYRDNSSCQQKIFEIQLKLAVRYQKPLVIHCVKAMNKIFEYSDVLKKIPSVIFHAYSGTLTEAKSLLSRGVNAYFSFGKNILTENKKAAECVLGLPEDRILSETDSPFMLKSSQIVDVIERISLLRFQDDFDRQIAENFKNAYLLQLLDKFDC